MEKRVDEKILDYINAIEAKEARKDICNGIVKIGNKYYEFEEKEFFDEKLKMYIPRDFEDIPFNIRKLKYPSENRPEIIKSNKSGSIAVTLKFVNNPLKEEYVEKLRDVMKLINKRLNPANVFYNEGVLEIEEKKIGYFDFKSSTIDDFLYNFIFILEFQEKTLIGTFSCGFSEHEEWKDVVIEMINTIKVSKDEKGDVG